MTSPIELTAPLLDHILFAMEDQDHLSVLNLETGSIETLEREEELEEVSFIPLPDWSSTDGFNMMRQFCENLHHPILQAELRDILDSGQGVFKRFKQTLKTNEFVYRNWLRFKRRFMVAVVLDWAETWSHALTVENPESAWILEKSALLETDFVVEEADENDSQHLELWDREACRDAGMRMFGEESALEFFEFWRRGKSWQKGDLLWKGVGADGDWAGILWARPWISPSKKTTLEVLLWYVDIGYRGLGLGGTLIDKLLKKAQSRKDCRIVIPSLTSEKNVERLLARMGFTSFGHLWVAQVSEATEPLL